MYTSSKKRKKKRKHSWTSEEATYYLSQPDASSGQTTVRTLNPISDRPQKTRAVLLTHCVFMDFTHYFLQDVTKPENNVL